MVTLMMKGRVFWTWDANAYASQSQKFKDREMRREKEKEEEKAKVDSKEQEEHSLVKNKHRILNCSQKKIVLGGPREREARKVQR